MKIKVRFFQHLDWEGWEFVLFAVAFRYKRGYLLETKNTRSFSIGLFLLFWSLFVSLSWRKKDKSSN